MSTADGGAIASDVYMIAQHAPLAEPEKIGFKAHNLLRLARIGMTVPEAFVLGTRVCAAYFADREVVRARIRSSLPGAVAGIEQTSGLGFGSGRRPLLLAVRSGAPLSMPGMLDTLLDVGLCDATLRGLLRLTGNPRLAWDTYRRLVQSFAEIVHDADPEPFRASLTRRLEHEHAASARELDYEALRELTQDYLALYSEGVGSPFPQDPYEQLEAAIAAVFESWNRRRAIDYRRLRNIPDDIGTAVTVQRMVFGNAGGTSGVGVAFTRNPSTGESQLYVDFRFDSQGEDLVSGRWGGDDTERLSRSLPAVAAQLAETRRTLEREFRDAQEFEFTVQDGRLFILQTRSAKRTAWAALRIAVEQARENLITTGEALARLKGLNLDRIERVGLVDRQGLELLGRGIAAGAGVAAGPIALDGTALQRIGGARNRAILVREDVSTDDIAAIAAAGGLLTAHGNRTAHAAVVARKLEKPCIVGCAALAIDFSTRTVRIGASTLTEGDMICLDAQSGEVFRGCPRTVVERPMELLNVVRSWHTPP